MKIDFNYDNNPYSAQHGKNINFGNRYTLYKLIAPIGGETVNRVEHSCQDIASILGKRRKSIKKIARRVSLPRLNFLDKLSKKYYYITNDGNDQARPSSKIVMDIFKSVKRPRKEHFTILENFNGNLQDLQAIFKYAKNKKDLAFVSDLQQSLTKETPNANSIIAALLKSQNKKEYISNLQQYKSYLRLNAENNNAVQELDKMVTEGSFDSKRFNIELASNAPILKIYNTEHLNPQSINNSEGLELLNHLPAQQISGGKNTVPEIIEQELNNLYETTNKNNITLRLRFIDTLTKNLQRRPDMLNNAHELRLLNILFQNADDNPQVRRFLEKVTEDNLDFGYLRELTAILIAVGPKRANIFYANLKRIVEGADGLNTIQALRNGITKTFYETPQMKAERDVDSFNKLFSGSPIKMTALTFKNIVNHLRYRFSKKSVPYRMPKQELPPYQEISVPREGPKTTDVPQPTIPNTASQPRPGSSNIATPSITAFATATAAASTSQVPSSAIQIEF